MNSISFAPRIHITASPTQESLQHFLRDRAQGVPLYCHEVRVYECVCVCVSVCGGVWVGVRKCVCAVVLHVLSITMALVDL